MLRVHLQKKVLIGGDEFKVKLYIPDLIINVTEYINNRGQNVISSNSLTKIQYDAQLQMFCLTTKIKSPILQENVFGEILSFQVYY